MARLSEEAQVVPFSSAFPKLLTLALNASRNDDREYSILFNSKCCYSEHCCSVADLAMVYKVRQIRTNDLQNCLRSILYTRSLLYLVIIFFLDPDIQIGIPDTFYVYSHRVCGLDAQFCETPFPKILRL